MNSKCEYNQEEVEQGVKTANDMIYYIVDLIKKIYSIVSGEYFAQLLKDALAKND